MDDDRERIEAENQRIMRLLSASYTALLICVPHTSQDRVIIAPLLTNLRDELARRMGLRPETVQAEYENAVRAL